MRIPSKQPRAGIALIIVMIIIMVFATLAAGLAYSMRVESKLARNASWDTELEWIGKSGVDYVKYVIAQGGQGPGGQIHALNQRWAGGTGDTNPALAEIEETVKIGHGQFTWKAIDCDRKFNINMAAQAPDILNQAFILMGIEATEAPHLVAAIQDWIDRDDNVTMGGRDTETAFYQSLRPPYQAKNGPIDDLSEMLLIKGVTPGMYFGSGNSSMSRSPIRTIQARDGLQEPTYPVGFVDLFTTVSGRTININTASATVLQLIPDVDGNMAQAIITTRAGPDGVEGNEDDMPFRTVGELSNVPGMTPQIAQLFARNFATRSTTFEIQVEAQIDQYKRTYHSLVRQINANQFATLYMWWD